MRYYDPNVPSAESYSNWHNASAFLTDERPRPRTSHRTEFVTFSRRKRVEEQLLWDPDRPTAPTHTTELYAKSEPSKTQTLNEGVPSRQFNADDAKVRSTNVERIAKDRVVLLAAKYAGASAQAEVVARLEILNNRLLEQAPRVSQDQVRALEAAANHVAKSNARREERARRLGLG